MRYQIAFFAPPDEGDSRKQRVGVASIEASSATDALKQAHTALANAKPAVQRKVDEVRVTHQPEKLAWK